MQGLSEPEIRVAILSKENFETNVAPAIAHGEKGKFPSRTGGKGFRKKFELLALFLVNMSLFVWIVLGWIAGYLISSLFKRSDESISLDLILGILGALIGGSLFTWFGATPVNQSGSVLAATTGAVLVLIVHYGIRRFFTGRLV